MTSSQLLPTFVTHIWQVTAVIVVVAVLIRMFARNRPHAALALWLLVLIKCVTPPVVFAPFGLFCHAGAEPTATVTESGPLGLFAAESHGDVARVFPDDVVETGSMSQSAVSPETAWTLAEWLVVFWLGGAVVMAIGSTLRVTVCLRRVRRVRRPAGSELVRMGDRLQRTLGVRRSVSLWVTSSQVGPAVVGLFRPTIIVPEVIAEDEAVALEPILAHELIHIRRGDLWLSVLGMLTRSLWWFHPLVWWVTRQLARDIERACDEEVLSALECPPADYARSLLRVLEHKSSLRPIPAFPGVRPVEVTSQRMERIMNLRQGRRVGAGWRCRLLLLIGAALTLPGAVSSQEQIPLKQTRTKVPAVCIKATVVTAPHTVIAKLIAGKPREELTGRLIFGFGVAVDGQARFVAEPTIAPGVEVRPVSASDAKPVARVRLVDAAEFDRIRSQIKGLADADVLMAPRLICRTGQTATCTTNIARDPASATRAQEVAGDTTLKVTPRVLEGGQLDLSVFFRRGPKSDVLQASAAARQDACEMQTRVRLKKGQVVLTVLPNRHANKGTLLILEAARSTAAVPPPVPAAALPPESVVIDAIIIGRSADATSEDVFAEMPANAGPSGTIASITRSQSGSEEKPGGAATESAADRSLILLPPDFLRSNRGRALPLLAEGWTVLSRPKVITVMGQPAAIEVGSEQSSLRLDLVPESAANGAIRLSGSVAREDQGQRVTKTFRNVVVPAQQATMLQLRDDNATFALVLSARVIRSGGSNIELAAHQAGRASLPRTLPVPDGRRLLPPPQLGSLRRPAARPEAQRKYVTRTYPVADLSIAVPNGPDGSPALLIDRLKQLVERTVEPESWYGQAGIQLHEPTLSLVVRQSPAVHDQIAQLFATLRRQQDQQLTVDAALYAVPSRLSHRSIVVARTIRLEPAPRGRAHLTAFSGGRMKFRIPYRLSDNSTVQVPITLAVAARPDGTIRTAFSVGDDRQVVNVAGNSELLADVTAALRVARPDLKIADDQSVLLFLRPRVIEAPEEELVLEK